MSRLVRISAISLYLPSRIVIPYTHPQWLVEIPIHVLYYAYEHRLLWVPCWHPYTHYLHDPDHRTLSALLARAAAKPERVWVCTLRDAASMITTSDQDDKE